VPSGAIEAERGSEKALQGREAVIVGGVARGRKLQGEGLPARSVLSASPLGKVKA